MRVVGTFRAGARNRLGGLHRAAFWRHPGFPNLVRARAGKAHKRVERLKREAFDEARRVNPFGLPEDAELWVSVTRKRAQQRGHKADSFALARKKKPSGY